MGSKPTWIVCLKSMGLEISGRSDFEFDLSFLLRKEKTTSNFEDLEVEVWDWLWEEFEWA